MGIRDYLPSPTFITLASSLFFSALIIYAANWYTHRTVAEARLAASDTATAQGDWERLLEEIQSQDPSYTLPEPPSTESVAALLKAAESPNVTATVGRTLLVNLSNAKSQGLGDDIPTQEEIVSAAMAQLAYKTPAKVYVAADLTVGEDTALSQHQYGNDVMEIVAKYPSASAQATLYSLARATDNNSEAELASLESIQNAYKRLVMDLVEVEVPQTLVPLHLQILNSINRVALSFDDMRMIIKDPLRGLQGLQQYQLMLGEAGRVFTTLAQQFSKNAILFTEDEPGNAWSTFLSTPQP